MTPPAARLRTGTRLLLAAVVASLGLAVAPSAGAADLEGPQGSVAHVERTDEGISLLVNVPADASVAPGSVGAQVNGVDYPASAQLAGDDTSIQRTTILAIDTSASMVGTRFVAAMRAARAFLAAVPDDVSVGVVTFAREVTTRLEPTRDRAAAREVVNDLTLSRGTRLYDGVLTAVAAAGDSGPRTVLVLSDGADTDSDANLAEVTSDLDDVGVAVDVVSLEQSTRARGTLAQLAVGGRVVEATSQALATAFDEEADALQRQVSVQVSAPSEVTSGQVSVEVTLPSFGGDVVAAATVPAESGATSTDSALSSLDAGPAPEAASTSPAWLLYAGVGVFGLGLLVALVMLAPAPRRRMTAASRVADYTTRTKAGASTGAGAGRGDSETRPDAEAALAQAGQAVSGVLTRNRGLEQRITKRLDGAGSDLKASEWLVVHAGIFVLSGFVGLLLGRGNLVVGLLFLALGAVGPWLYLGVRRSRRRKAFSAALPDVLQMMSGSLTAGLSLNQSVDTVVREGPEPVASEFKRVLIETRIGISLEDAFEGVVERFESKDFAWVVMAIRIQRQVGGNLAELLDTVAATMREREYLRRQVGALAAEGKLSAYVLGGLPPAFLLYLVAANGDYVSVLFTDPRGILMLVGAVVWLGIGVFWMSKLIKVEV